MAKERPKNRGEVIAYAETLGVTGVTAACFWEHGVATNWTMRDGQHVQDWKACFRLWVERSQGRPGQEIVFHPRPAPERKRESGERRILLRDRIIRAGRRLGADDEKIEVVLEKYGLTWEDGK